MSQLGSAYVDDASIKDEAQLWRRIPPRLIIYDENLQRYRPSSAAFSDHPNGTPMSVVLGDEVLQDGQTAESVLKGHEGYSLASITAALARQQGQGIRRQPLPQEPAHAEVFGKKTKRVKRALAKGARWQVPPTSPPTKPRYPG